MSFPLLGLEPVSHAGFIHKPWKEPRWWLRNFPKDTALTIHLKNREWPGKGSATQSSSWKSGQSVPPTLSFNHTSAQPTPSLFSNSKTHFPAHPLQPPKTHKYGLNASKRLLQYRTGEDPRAHSPCQEEEWWWITPDHPRSRGRPRPSPQQARVNLRWKGSNQDQETLKERQHFLSQIQTLLKWHEPFDTVSLRPQLQPFQSWESCSLVEGYWPWKEAQSSRPAPAERGEMCPAIEQEKLSLLTRI